MGKMASERRVHACACDAVMTACAALLVMALLATSEAAFADAGRRELPPPAPESDPVLAPVAMGDVVFVVTGQYESGSSGGGKTPAYIIPVGGLGSAFQWNSPAINFPTGSIHSFGTLANGTLNGSVSARLAMSPEGGQDRYATRIQVQVYVRGTEKCYTARCGSYGTLRVSRPQGCAVGLGPFAAATWDASTAGALNRCTPDTMVTLGGENCLEEGTSCCTATRFPEAPGVDYTLAFSKVFEGSVAQQTVQAAAAGLPIVASLDVDFSVTARLTNCQPDTSKSDLVVESVSASGLTTDCKSLEVSGQLQAVIANLGEASPKGPFVVVFFEDRNRDGSCDPDSDGVLARTSYDGPLPSGARATVETSVDAGVSMLFADNRVLCMVDADRAVSEQDEANNVLSSDGACAVAPVAAEFAVAQKWAWTASLVQPSALNVGSTPAVGDLNGDGIPEIVFASGAGTGGDNTAVGYLRVIRGDTGAEEFTVSDPAQLVNMWSSFAVGNIDSDPQLEIIAVASGANRLVAFEHDGTLKWFSPTLESIRLGGPALVDLDRDGAPEILVGRQVLSANGTLRWTGTSGVGGPYGPLSLAADLDLDGTPEVVTGNTAYTSTGAVRWQASSPSGFNAVANFDTDPYPEVVVVANGNLYLLEHTGAVKWGPIALPGGGYGGPPTVADFDDDGEPEIGVAGRTRYVVFESNGNVLWQSPVQDVSSNVTGSSVFDFEGDGAAEVIYRDELRLRVYRGRDGQILFETPMSSCTAYEYPLVADVDADGQAEIVSTANNNCGYGPQRGVFVFGARDHNWVTTRRVWNQHTYHITNVNDDGSIPTVEKNSWQYPVGKPFNSYRQNQLFAASPFAAADLSASRLQFPEGVCADSIRVTVRVGNGGSNVAPARTSVALYLVQAGQSGALIGLAQTSRPLAPGQFEDVAFKFAAPAAGSHVLWASVDDDGQAAGVVRECDEANNRCSASLVITPPPVCLLEEPELAPAPETSGNTLCLAATPPQGISIVWQLIPDPGASGWEIESGQGTPCLTYKAGSGLDSVTVAVRLVSASGCVDSCAVRFGTSTGRFCTLTQSYWKHDTLDMFLQPRDTVFAHIVSNTHPIVLGVPKSENPDSRGSITFRDGGESCINRMLPNFGWDRSFPANMGDLVPTSADTCSLTMPDPEKTYTAGNSLLGEGLALQLNLRASPGLAGVRFVPGLMRTNVDPGPDRLWGTSDDSCTEDSPAPLAISDVVLEALEQAGIPRTIGGLGKLANLALAGLPIEPATLSDVSTACWKVNTDLKLCRCLRYPISQRIQMASLRAIPMAFGMSQNLPNPFQRSTTFRCALPERARVELVVYSVQGQRVATPVAGDYDPGNHAFEWGAMGQDGHPLHSGVYFVRMKALGLQTGKQFETTKQVTIIR